MSSVKRAWNGGSREAALAAAQRRADEAIAAGCQRCTACKGDGGMSTGVICLGCGGAGFLVPPGGMPIIRIQKMPNPETSNLREFIIAIEWSAPGHPHQETVIARSVEDAKEIAVRLFRAARIPEAVVDSVKEISNAQS